MGQILLLHCGRCPALSARLQVLSMCSYNFNVAVRISINPEIIKRYNIPLFNNNIVLTIQITIFQLIQL